VTTFLQLIVVGISTGSVFGIVGMALVLVYRTTGIVNFAQGVSAVLGGLLTFELQQHMPLALAIVGAIVLAALLATLTAVIAVGFRGRTTHLASLIITVGIALLAEAILLATFGEVPRSYPGISEHAWDLGGVLVQPQYLLITVVALAAAAGLTFFLRRTIVGQALVASADSPRAAELVGLNVRSIAVIAFAVAAALCALGGALLAPTVPVVYNTDLAITINGFAAAVFGGLASIRLALLGGYALGIVEQLVVGYVDPQYNLTIALVAMLILIGWRSRGELAV
jgi:branched-chain amino acid transport system permease protein